MKKNWEKIFEYASMPLHGTMSRKLRKGVSLQINEGKVYEKAVIFLGEEFVRITQDGDDMQVLNAYYDWAGIRSIGTYSQREEKHQG
ncbi:hypothetical protein [Desulfurivibrio dismutans]|uniref:hypothetical protein n=1 Tax=Desulfurivibrio dismutans TaxID=1398908 RepID=UPI0023DAB3F1|nr:hypothetical protein [Desulfurivibrio alkaliphilus]MDF1614090.1 hypothetical protein [Desulfurivibrio alkaliphilus]